MLKLKLPLLTVSLSMSLLAVQPSMAAPFAILPLGDSITNGIYNGGNKLSYRDDLRDTLSLNKYDFEFVGRCPDTGDDGGQCEAPSVYKGKTLKHEGRAGYHANEINDNLEDWLDWYTPSVALVHIGTNDIFNQDNDVNKTDTLIEPVTYNTTLHEIESIIEKLKAKKPKMVIFVAKILPIGKVNVTPGGTTVNAQPYGGPGDDAAKGLNDLMDDAWATAQGVTVVDQNTDFNFDDHFHEGLVHPNEAGEESMSNVWFEGIESSTITPDAAVHYKSTITTDVSDVIADNTAFATITVQAKFPSGNDLATGGDTVTFEIFSDTTESATTTTVIDNGDGTYTTTVKASKVGDVVIRAAINNQYIKSNDDTATVRVTFVAEAEEQTISFTSPSSKNYGDAPFVVDVKSVTTGATPGPTGLDVIVTSTNTNICSVDQATKKVTIKGVGNCELVASQAGGVNPDGVSYSAADSVSKTVVINQAVQTITFANTTPTTAIIGDTFSVSATSTSGLPVRIKTATPTICSLDSSNKVTILKANSDCKLKAEQEGNNNYQAATVTHSIDTADSITFPDLNDKTVGDAPFIVDVKAASGNPVTLTSLNATVCTVKENKVTLVASGTCSLQATVGDITATKEFTVNKSASQVAMDTVAKVINGSGSITVAQLEPIKGLKNLKKGRDYTKAIKAGTYKDKNNPTVEELQKAIDKANSDANKSGGSTSPLWLLTLGLVALFRRKEQS